MGESIEKVIKKYISNRKALKHAKIVEVMEKIEGDNGAIALQRHSPLAGRSYWRIHSTVEGIESSKHRFKFTARRRFRKLAKILGR